MSWNIDQVDDETRRAAEAAARQAGVPLEEWLRRAIALSPAAAPPRSRPAETDDLAAVAGSIARLARRVRAMSKGERAAVAGLSGRLDEIERQLGRLHDSERRGEPASGSLRDLNVMVGRLARDIEDADERARSMVEGIGARAAASGARGAAFGGGVADRTARPADPRLADFDELRARLDSLLARAPEDAAVPPPARAASLDQTLRTLEERIDEAKARLAPPAAPERPRYDDGRMRELEDRLAEIASRLATPPEPPVGPDIAEQIAEIVSRKRPEALGDEIAAIRNENRGLAAEIAALRSEVSDLVGRVLAVGLGAAEDQESHFALIRRIEALTAANPVDRQTLGAIRDEVAHLRETVAATARETTLLDRFDELLRRVPDKSRLDALGGEIADLRRHLEADDSPKTVARLEMRMNELARSVETTFNARQAAAEASAVGTAAALADIRGAIEDLAAGRGPAIDDGQFAALAAGLAEVRRAVEAKQGAGPDGEALSRLEDRLEDIAARIDGAFDRPAPGLDALHAEIAAIRDEIGLREPPRVDHLEAQIRDLADRLDTAVRPDADAGQLAELEARVAGIAAMLDQTDPRMAALDRVEADLAGLQTILTDSREDSIAAARAAAREAVRDLGGTERDKDMVRALKVDLDRVRHAADDTGHRTEETLKGLQMTLASIVERLGRIEGEGAAQAAALPPPEAPIRSREATPPPLARATEDAIRRARPVEPGAPRADLAALRELAASSTETDRRSTDRRADFIAAARRAASAAVAEAGTAEEAEPEPRREDGAFARIGQAIRNRRKPLLLAAAAIVIALGTLHLYGNRGGAGQSLATAADPSPAIALVTAPAPTKRAPAAPAVAASATASVP
ncbi:MAG TPA: hypothetical protein PKA74_03335, partial [Bauldia sp.]|nr:hypothetical protein [Bauldia sp.]